MLGASEAAPHPPALRSPFSCFYSSGFSSAPFIRMKVLNLNECSLLQTDRIFALRCSAVLSPPSIDDQMVWPNECAPISSEAFYCVNSIYQVHPLILQLLLLLLHRFSAWSHTKYLHRGQMSNITAGSVSQPCRRGQSSANVWTASTFKAQFKPHSSKAELGVISIVTLSQESS